MNKKIIRTFWTCRRCGALQGEQPKTGTAYNLNICEACDTELAFWLKGSPVLMWHPVKVRELTDEDREELTELGYSPDQIEEVTYLEGTLPEDGQEILITFKGNNGRPVVWNDTAVVDGRDYWLDSGLDWEDVTAWASMPAPYLPPGEEGEK